MIMKKTYKKPNLTVVRLNAELPMAASGIDMMITDDMAGGVDALGNIEGNFDIWKNDKSAW